MVDFEQDTRSMGQLLRVKAISGKGSFYVVMTMTFSFEGIGGEIIRQNQSWMESVSDWESTDQ